MTVTILWCAVGLITGTSHAHFLWHSARDESLAAGAILRLSAVGAVFFGAALLGGILPMAGGWAVAFPAAVIRLYQRKDP